MPNTTHRIALSFGIAIGSLAAAEMSLRWLNPQLEEVVSPLLYQRNSGDAFTAGTSPGSRVYVSGRRRAATNTVSGKRVLVFGASAAYGEMYSAFSAFPGIAEAMLRRSTEVPIEVLNLSHGGMGSRQVGEMVFRVLEHGQADLLVIYTGNNEFHELRALKARSERYNAKAEMLRRRLSASFLYRQLREWFIPTEEILAPPEGEEWLPVGRMDVTVDDDDRALGVALYGEHLRDIVLAAREHKVPILLTTVASNLRDHLDHGTSGKLSQTGERALHDLEGMVDKIPAARFAAEAAKRLSDIDTEEGLHKLGNLYLRAKLPLAAKDAFERKELAALRPMTSNRAMRNTVKHIGTKYGVPVCDLEASLSEVARDGIPGNDVFIDHCHPNADGHQQLGLALARCIANEDLLQLGALELPMGVASDNLFRVDHYRGYRPIPGMATIANTHPPGSAENATFEGHQAFVADRFDEALEHYEHAGSLGAPTASIQHSIGLTQLYRGDVAAARTALERAQQAGDVDAGRVLATLNP
jgi:hypothetical protein